MESRKESANSSFFLEFVLYIMLIMGHLKHRYIGINQSIKKSNNEQNEADKNQ